MSRRRAAALLAACSWAVGTSTAGAQEVPVERARVVDAAGDPVRGGGSRSPFTLELPDDAACPGDSADDDYRVNTFMVASQVDPRSVPYDGLGPSPRVHGEHAGFRQPLYDVSSTFVVSQLTEDAAEPGAPGPIVALPLLDFAVYAPGDLPPGSYRLGVSCTLHNETVRVWDAEVRVTADPADAPGGIRWEVVGAVDGDADGGLGPVPVVLGAVAVAGVAVLVLYRRRPAPATTSAPEEGT